MKIKSGLSVLCAVLFFCSTLVAEEAAISHSISDEDIAWGPCPPFFPEGRCTSDVACVLFIAFEEPVDAFEAK